MKPIHLLAISLVTALTASAQNTYPFPASGNVGIGTTDPQEKIHIGGSASRLRFDSNTNIARVLLYGDGSGINDYGFGIDSTDLVSIFGAGGGMAFKTSGVGGQTLMRITGQGNVGIGTASPIAKLTIVGGSADPLQLKDSAGHSFRVGPGVGIAGGFQLYDDVAGAVRLRIDDSGNVGIGTTAPSVKLTVASPQSSATNTVIAEFSKDGGNNSYGSALLRISRSIGGESTDFELNSGGDGPFRFGTFCDTLFINNQNATNGPYGSIHFVTNGDERMTIGGGTLAGNVGIGTTNPTHKLAVNGTIKAKEVIVETTGWSDYVFADNYTLQSLAEVEDHIRTRKHLPGIPSASEVAEQGVSIGDMQARLLAKVEELTLHIIAQQKEMNTMRLRLQQLESR